ncbi:MAG: hypothetical protein IH957_08045 [Chloroflexi bacterium]|nr:hypothetical protein [Chloroflexota bacterium]
MDEATRREWRELGFYYKLDHDAKEWRLTGSCDGLLRFRDLLLAYVVNTRREGVSEHEHYGPYSYLEVMTWPEAGFDDHAIRGSLADLARLASLVEARLSDAQPGASIRIRDEFAADSPYALVLNVRDDGFDPVIADEALTNDG